MYACGCWSSACSIPTESAENSRNKECILTACSATGTGEHLISSMIAKEVCTELSRSSSEPKEIVERFMKSSFLNSNTQRFGGFIALRVHPEEKCLDFVWSHSTGEQIPLLNMNRFHGSWLYVKWRKITSSIYF